jgi:hypothetical protein
VSTHLQEKRKYRDISKYHGVPGSAGAAHVRANVHPPFETGEESHRHRCRCRTTARGTHAVANTHGQHRALSKQCCAHRKGQGSKHALAHTNTHTTTATPSARPHTPGRVSSSGGQAGTSAVQPLRRRRRPLTSPARGVPRAPVQQRRLACDGPAIAGPAPLGHRPHRRRRRCPPHCSRWRCRRPTGHAQDTHIYIHVFTCTLTSTYMHKHSRPCTVQSHTQRSHTQTYAHTHAHKVQTSRMGCGKYEGDLASERQFT